MADDKKNLSAAQRGAIATILATLKSMPFNYRLSTSGYPAGLYRFYVEYKTLYRTLDSDIIQTLTVDFEIR